MPGELWGSVLLRLATHIHLIAVADVGEVEHFEHRFSLLSLKFPMWHRDCLLGDEDVVLAEQARLQLALAEGRDELRLRLPHTSHVLRTQPRDWDHTYDCFAVLLLRL